MSNNHVNLVISEESF